MREDGASSAGVYRPEETRRDEARRRIRDGSLLLLDGATGTELERRGLSTALPLWSTPALVDHPDIVRSVHADYARAGVDALTANTFRTQRRVLAGGGLAEEAFALTQRAVVLAREGANVVAAPPLVFGSAPPLEDCYHPERVPADDDLVAEHAEHASHLDRAGVDAVLVETMNTAREAEIATRAAVARGLPVITSFVCWSGATLLDGSPLHAAAARALAAGALAVGVNCLPASNVPACLSALLPRDEPVCVYANLGVPDPHEGFVRSDEGAPESFAVLAEGWVQAGARLVGGCCGTTPAHLAAMHARLRPEPRTR